MSNPRVLILRTAGVNCDFETAWAFEKVGAQADRVHVNRLADGSVTLDDYDILALPGGFSYGDDVASGRIFAVELLGRLGDALKSFVDKKRLIIGICNGFQVLVGTCLLPGESDGQTATLTTNDSSKFEDRWVTLENSLPNACVWTRGIERITLPVAHGEGKFIAPEALISQMKTDGRVVFRYVSGNGAEAGYPDNPNGSMENIAGITDSTGLIFGLMPHPERHLLPWHHPSWTRRETQPAEGDGLAIFRNAVDYIG